MPNFGYTRDVPFPDHNPSTDQPDMLINTNSTDSIIAVDHFSFEDNSGGTHKQVQLINTLPANGVIPTGLQGNGWETLYASVPTGGVGELFFVRGASATGIRLTGPGTPSATNNGYTFLAGGILLQWGIFTGAATSGTIDFSILPNIVFPNQVFMAVLTPKYNSGVATPIISTTYIIDNATFTNSGFGWTKAPLVTANYTGFYWIAIGR
jgi:hypothetical protein